MLAALGAVAGLERRARGPRAALLADQDRRLVALLAHARDRVAFYGELWDGVDLGAVRCSAGLAALPTVRKRELRAVPRAERVVRGSRLEGLASYRTSGTTGEPFEILRSFVEDQVLGLFLWRAWRMVGARLGERRVFVGLVKQPADRVGIVARLSRSLRRRTLRRVDCTAPLEQIAAQMRGIRPHLLHGYPSVLGQLAALHRRAPVAAPRLIISGGEVLTAAARQEIAAAFGAPVRDIYSSYECLVMAWECDRTGLYHVNDDAVVLEVLDGGRPVAAGEEGDVVVTALHSWTMPFVRYEIGDRAVRGPTPCPCGRPFSTLVAIGGRRIDYYTLPDGRLMHHYAVVTPAMDRAKARDLIARYQLVQERRDLFLLRAAALGSEGEAAARRFGSEIRAILGPGVELRFEAVGPDAFAPAGKFRVGTSNVTVSP